jgi:PAS domain S-box-containing protein
MRKSSRPLHRWIQSLNPNHHFRAKLALIIGCFAGLVLVLMSSAASHRLTSELQRTIGQSLDSTAQRIATNFERAMFEHYREMQILASRNAIEDPTVNVALKRSLLQVLKDTHVHYDWIGLIDAEGTVIAATEYQQEGQNLRDRPLLQAGFKDAFSSEVYLVESAIPDSQPAPSVEPTSPTIEIVAPIRDPQGNQLGVVAARLDWNWIEELEQSFAGELSNQVNWVLFNGQGQLLYVPGQVEGYPVSEIRQFDHQLNSNQSVFKPVLIDEEPYFIGYSALTGYQDYPDLNWTVMVWQPAEVALAPAKQVRRRFWVWTGLGTLLLAGLSWLLADRLTRPIQRIAKAADRLSQGQADLDLPMFQGQDEIARLSRSLRHLLSVQQQHEQQLAQRNTQLQAELEQHQRTTTQLQHQTAQLRAIEANLPGAFYTYVLAPNGSAYFEYISEGCYPVYGYTAEQVMANSQLVLGGTHPDDLAALQQATTISAQQRSPFSCEFRYIAPTGEVRWVLVNSNPEHRADDSIAWRGVLFDVTERKRIEMEHRAAEIALQEREYTYQQILDAIPDLVLCKGEQSKIIYGNKAFREFYGMNLAQLYHLIDAPFNDPDYTQQYIRDDATVFNSGQPLNIPEEPATSHDGRVRLFHTIKVPIFNSAGEVIQTVGVSRDITEQKQAEQTRYENEAKLRVIFEQAAVGMSLSDRQTGEFLHVNQRFCDLLGYTEAEMLQYTWQEITNFRNSVGMGELTASQLIYANQSSFSIEKQYVTRSGEARWVNVSISVVRDAMGTARYDVCVVQDIHERKLVEQALQRSEARYRSLITAIAQAVWVTDADGSVVEDIPSWRSLTGFSEAETQGWGWLTSIHPDDRDRTAAEFSRCLQTKSLYQVEIRVRVADGSYRFFLVRGVPVTDADRNVVEWLGTHTDITNRKRAEAALRESEERLRLALTSANQGLWDLNLQTGEAVVNAEYVKMLGYDLEGFEETNEKWRDRLHPEDQSRVYQIYQDYISGKRSEYQVEFRQRTQAGDWKWILSVGKVVAWDAEGKPLRMLGTHTDISERKRHEAERQQAEAALRQAEMELRQVNQELEKRVVYRTQALTETNNRLSLANAELARASRMKDEFLANMSHELRTPLNAVIGLSEALLEEVYGPLTAKQRKSLTTIETSGQHLLTLINDILDLSKIESGRMELHLAPVILQELAESSLAFVKQQAHQKRIQLTLQVPEGAADVLLDEARMRQALINLLSNAVKFTPQEGRVRLEVEANPAEEVLKFHVIDTGIGIAPEHFLKLFQPFVQVDSSLSRRYGGTGLGLSLVRRIAELHGGGVELESEVGRGSHFTLAVPWKAALGVPPVPAPVFQSTLKQVLIIEDSTDASSQICRYLKEWQISSQVQHDGQGAIAKVLETQPDLIVLDILLPHCSGWEILSQLKADHRTQSIPVLIVTVVDDEGQAMQQGADGFLLKPITRDQLATALQQIAGADWHPTIKEDADSQSTPFILLAEDNEANIDTLLGYLEAQGYRLAIARNGKEAVELAKQHPPDLILMDIQMPEMDGLQAMQLIRQEPNLATLPIIALTALAMPKDRERCLAAGANEYLTKPVNLKGLKEAIDQFINPSKPC